MSSGSVAVAGAGRPDPDDDHGPGPGPAAGGQRTARGVDEHQRSAGERPELVGAGRREQPGELAGVDDAMITDPREGTGNEGGRDHPYDRGGMELHDRLFGSTPGDDDDTRWAASGAMALTGAPDGPPALPPRSLVPVVNAAAVAIATSSRALGRTVELDALALLGERAAIASFSRHGRRSAGGSTELHRCADGWLAVTLARSDDVELLPAWLGTTDVAVGVGERTAADLVGAAAELGLPCGSLGEVAAEQPAFVTHAGPGAQPHDSLAGVVVVDLSSLWAGPLCGPLLGEAGARGRQGREHPPARRGPRGPPAFFDLLHAGHESVALDFADAGRRRRAAAGWSGAPTS